jgi:hypothetical protein
MSEKYPVRTRTRNLDKVFILRTVFRLGTLQEPRELRWVGKPFGTCCLFFKLVLAKKRLGFAYCLLYDAHNNICAGGGYIFIYFLYITVE